MIGTKEESFPYWMCREWTEADLAPLPPGWRTGPPAFVGVGVPKAGTTWLYSMLVGHPQIEPNRFRKKELQFYAVPSFEDQADRTPLYHDAFAAPSGSLSGEWTPNYLDYPLAIARLAQAAPDTKVLLSLRNPVDRTISNLNHLSYRPERLGIADEQKQDFLYRYSLFPEAVHGSHVAGDLRVLFSHFAREQVLVLQYERWKTDPTSELRRMYEFLGVDPDAAPPDTGERVNELAYQIEKPDSAEREAVTALFRDELSELAELLPELDFDLWA